MLTKRLGKYVVVIVDFFFADITQQSAEEQKEAKEKERENCYGKFFIKIFLRICHMSPK